MLSYMRTKAKSAGTKATTRPKQVVPMTGKSYSAKLEVELDQIDELKNKHGDELRRWWQNRFGFDYDCLTSSEARYLIRTPSPDRIRNRIIAAVEE